MNTVLVAFFILISASVSQVQVLATANSLEYKDVLKLSASLFVRRTFQLGSDHYLTPNPSFHLAGVLTFKDSDNEQVWGIRGEAQMRLHVYTVINPRSSSRRYFCL